MDDDLGNPQEVHLDDGTIVSGTHVIGADGKWSKVLQCINSQASMLKCPSFLGLFMEAPIVPEEGWKTNGTTVIKPSDPGLGFYISIVSSRSKLEGNGLALTMVIVSDSSLKKYPWWLAPRDADLTPGIASRMDWGDVRSSVLKATVCHLG
jgi:2-polyprenyl-6-methoxyphenol hydroxylase-like FAD-dependent oxidoreductase